MQQGFGLRGGGSERMDIRECQIIHDREEDPVYWEREPEEEGENFSPNGTEVNTDITEQGGK